MRAFLDKMSELYYKGTPAISDQEFDLLADKHDYTRVGYTVTDAISQAFQMYSLQKCFDITKAPLDPPNGISISAHLYVINAAKASTSF